MDPEPPLPTTPRRILFSVAKHWEQSFEEVQRWSWPFFCGAWADMIDQVRRDTLRERRMKRKRRAEDALRRGHEEGRAMLDAGGF